MVERATIRMQDDKIIEAAYNQKDSSYYAQSRSEMQSLVPTDCRKLLDVGCGTGAFARAVKDRLGCEVWGIEPHESAVEIARTRLDHVVHGLFREGSGLPQGRFDCISFNDVLEHIQEPEAALKYAQSLLAPNGCVIASIPNIGHFPITWRLVMRGEWDYADLGILDRTHMRYYTRKSVSELFKAAGFRSMEIGGLNPFFSIFDSDRPLWRYYRLLCLIRRPGVHDMRYLQFSVRARL